MNNQKSMPQAEALEKLREAIATYERDGNDCCHYATDAISAASDLAEVMLATPQPQPQASAEDVALVDDCMSACKNSEWEAWQRIRASLGVSNG